MDAFEPDFEIIKMDAEVTSYQGDDEPERERFPRESAPAAGESAAASGGE